MLYRPPVWCLHIIYWFLASWGPMWRNGRGVAWHCSKYFFEAFLVMLYRPPCMMPPYDLLIPGKLGCNVTKREGGGLALFQIFFWSLPCDALQTPLYDASIWSTDSWQVRVQCDETGGVAWHWSKCFFKALLVMSVEDQWDGASRKWDKLDFDNNSVYRWWSNLMWAFEDVKEPDSVLVCLLDP